MLRSAQVFTSSDCCFAGCPGHLLNTVFDRQRKPSRKTLDCIHPSPCGFHGDAQKPCSCAPAVVTKYQKRNSGSLQVEIPISRPVTTSMPEVLPFCMACSAVSRRRSDPCPWLIASASAAKRLET